MKVRNLGICLVTLMMLAPSALAQRPPGPGPTKTPRPEAIARHCLDFVNRTTARATDLIGMRGRRVVFAINELLADGRVGAANDLGRIAIDSINRVAHRAGEEIDHAVGGCVQMLMQAGAPEALIRRVQAASDQAKTLIERQRSASVGHIQDALN